LRRIKAAAPLDLRRLAAWARVICIIPSTGVAFCVAVGVRRWSFAFLLGLLSRSLLHSLGFHALWLACLFSLWLACTCCLSVCIIRNYSWRFRTLSPPVVLPGRRLDGLRCSAAGRVRTCRSQSPIPTDPTRGPRTSQAESGLAPLRAAAKPLPHLAQRHLRVRASSGVPLGEYP
jgi:hypothetical protein